MGDAQVSAASMKKLREAMQRLLAGQPRRTDGALTKNNLYAEAGVSRATMNRAASILAEWDAAVHKRPSRHDQADEVTLQLRRDLRKSQDAARDLRSDLNTAATVIQALYAENVNLREKLKRIRKDEAPKLGQQPFSPHSVP
jgi:hypothetical protein